MSRHWCPDGARYRGHHRPEPGSLIATGHRTVMRVVAYRPYYQDQWTDAEHERVAKHGQDHAPYHVILRPPHITETDPRARDHDKSYSIRDPERITWWVYPDEHYPLCGACGEPTPCREREAARETERAVQAMAHYEDPTKCPGCLKTVTKRGRHLTLPNVVVPLGEPVTFHLHWGSRCWAAARDYERQVADVDPTYRPALSCEGHLTVHITGRRECTRGDACPGDVDHRSFGRCYCPPESSCANAAPDRPQHDTTAGEP